MGGWLDGAASISVPDGDLHQSGYRSQGRSQLSGRLQFELRLAQARRWKWNSVHLVQQNRSARQCLWALSMDSTRNNKYNKNMPPLGIWLRIRSYLVIAASALAGVSSGLCLVCSGLRSDIKKLAAVDELMASA